MMEESLALFTMEGIFILGQMVIYMPGLVMVAQTLTQVALRQAIHITMHKIYKHCWAKSSALMSITAAGYQQLVGTYQLIRSRQIILMLVKLFVRKYGLRGYEIRGGLVLIG